MDLQTSGTKHPAVSILPEQNRTMEVMTMTPEFLTSLCTHCFVMIR